MDELARAFSDSGYPVFRPAFTGHCGDPEGHFQIRAEQWEADARRFYGIAKAKSDALRVPLLLVAYSFSGLVFQALGVELPFQRRVYFAPPFETHFWYPLAVWLAGIWPGFTYRTMIPEGYFANERAGLRSLLALDAFLERWRQGRGGGDSAPVLIWDDPGDELVDAPALRKLAEAQRGWSFRALSVDESTLPGKYHHLLIDSQTLGPSEFRRAVKETAEFLAGRAGGKVSGAGIPLPF
jgi:hypothetical protein